MVEENLQNQVDEMRTLLASQLHARGRTLEAQIHKAGRRLPRRLRGDAKLILRDMSLIQNPKLARMVDQSQTSLAADRIIGHLNAIDTYDRFKGRVLSLLGAISAVLIITFVLVVYVLVKRGLL
jgi:hypothetical protein